MPASNVTRVRRLGFWNSIASVRPASGTSGCRRIARYSALSRPALANIRSTSAAETSATDRKSRPASDSPGLTS